MRHWSRYGVNGALEMTFMNYELWTTRSLLLVARLAKINHSPYTHVVKRYSATLVAQARFSKLHGEKQR